jgi:soluble P-type ATPase
MIALDIPGYGRLALQHLVMDYNGTLACDGRPVSGARGRLEKLSESLELHVVTADTFGSVRAALEGWPCAITVLPEGDQAKAKLAFVDALGRQQCACIGNGRNDRLMLQAAGLGVAVLLDEGTSREAMLSADIVTPGILPALDLLLHTYRLTATLRS